MKPSPAATLWPSRATTTCICSAAGRTYYLRARIESVRGHLSNDECAAKLLELIQEGCKKFALCHLSQENNTPMLALQTVFSTLGTAGVVPDKDCIVQTQRRNEVSPALAF